MNSLTLSYWWGCWESRSCKIPQVHYFHHFPQIWKSRYGWTCRFIYIL